MAQIRELAVSFQYIDLRRTQEGTQAWSRLLLSKAVSQSVMGYHAMSDRILLMKIHGQPFDQSIVQVYVPTSASTEVEIEDLYSDLEEAYDKCGRQYIVIVMGDMSAKVRSEQDPLNKIVGGHELGERNE